MPINFFFFILHFFLNNPSTPRPLKEIPGIVEPLLNERDRYLTHNLRKACRHIASIRPAGSNPIMVAVVGMGHVGGIKNCFYKELDEQDFARISQKPQAVSVKQTLFTYVVAPALVGYVALSLVRAFRAVKQL